MPEELVGTKQGEVLAQSLETALVVATQSEPVYSTTTATGNVTAVKLERPTEEQGPTVLVLNRTRDTATPITVVLPPNLIGDLSSEGNVIMVVTEVTDELARELPPETAGGDTVMVNSPIVELSFAREVSGEVALLEVSQAFDTINFTVVGRPPNPGERCAFFNSTTGSWSAMGTEIASQSSVNGQNLEAAWCKTTHTSMFAIVETIPFDVLWETSASKLNASGYVVVLAIVMVLLCFGGVIVCFLLARRLRPPSRGTAKLLYKKGQMKPMSFQCSRVITDGVQEVDTGSPTNAKVKKVLVKWDIEPQEMVEDLNDLRGFRRVMTDLGGPMREVVRVNTDQSHLSRVSSRKTTQQNVQQLQDVFGTMILDDDEEELGMRLTEPEEDVEDAGASLLIDIDEAIDIRQGTGVLTKEAYEHEEAVLYFSTSQQCYIPAKVEGPGTFEEDGMLPLYSLLVGVRAQLRERVPMQLLRAPLKEGVRVEAFSESLQKWVPALILKEPLRTVSHLSNYHIALDDPALADRERTPLWDMPLGRLRRRFEPGAKVLVYRGRDDGWVAATVAALTIESAPPQDVSLAPTSPREADPASPRAVTGATTLVPVTFPGTDSTVDMPSFQVREQADVLEL